MNNDILWIIAGVIVGMIVGTVITDGGQCFLPFVAIFLILGLLVFIGLLVDPKETLRMLGSIKSDWNDILNDD